MSDPDPNLDRLQDLLGAIPAERECCYGVHP